jgi:hypothetical protein
MVNFGSFGSYAEQASWSNDTNSCAITHAILNHGGGTGGNTVTVTNPGNQSGTVGSAVSVQVNGSDSASGQTLSYSATGLPAGLSISASGLITGTPTAAGTSTVTVTATDGTGAKGTASFTFTVAASAGSCTAPGQLIGNGGFETGTAAPWTTTSGVLNNSTGEPAHSGSWDAWMDGYGTQHTDTVAQTVTIPANCKGSFTFWLHIDSANVSGTAADTLALTANGTTVKTFSNLDANSGYTQQSVDMSAYAGQTVTLQFTGTESGNGQTSFVLDDAALNVG